MKKYGLLRRKYLKADNNGMIPLRFILLFGVLAFVAILVFAEMMFCPVSVSHCHDGEQVILSGDFKGFSKGNSTVKGTLVFLDNSSYLFRAFDPEYMSELIGQRVTITCCFHNQTMNEYYDFMSARIQ